MKAWKCIACGWHGVVQEIIEAGRRCPNCEKIGGLTLLSHALSTLEKNGK